MSPYVAEFFGTMILILLGEGVVAGVLLKDSKAENAGWLTTVVSWGLAVTLSIYAVGRISGAHLNPAITLALLYTGDFPASQVPGYLLAQFSGAFCGAVLVWIHYFPHWKITDDPAKKLAVFCTAPAIRSPLSNLVSEVIATAVLLLGILFIGENKFTEGLNPLVVGGLIMAIGLCLGGTTGFAINPARDLAPRFAHFILPIAGKGSSDWSYSWIPVAGPVIGGLLGATIFKYLF
ncbi:MAG: MIP/aquaporin family protein [Chryseolinea sp.]